MPDMSIINDKNVTHQYRLAASQTILPGQPVVLNASGLVELANASSAALLGTSMGKVTNSAAGDLIQVFDDPDAEFEILADNASQATRSRTGDLCDLVVSGGVFYANLDASSTGVLRVIQGLSSDFDPLMDGATIYGSALAGDFTPAWNNTARVHVKIDLHQRGNQARLS